MIGFLNIRKPPGPTSHDIVAMVRRMVPRDTSVGHAGTLDPFASGVLIVCLGGACRLSDLVMGQDKKYVTTIQLGGSSNTDDLTGNIIPTPGAQPPDLSTVADTLRKFLGTVQQVPPSHSAALVDGRRAYKIARAGKEVALAPRPVEIHSIELLEYKWPLLQLEIRCGCGTYIRSLARDIGRELGVGGYCTELARTAIGTFTVEDGVDLESLDIARDLTSALTAVVHMSRLNLDDHQVHQILLGRRIAVSPALPEGEVAMLAPSGELLALGVAIRGGECVQPSKVLVNTHALGIRKEGTRF